MQIHGGQSLDERKAQRIAFEKDGTILISTEAGSEGANLHRQCHLMVNYDLPWNPMRLLQRIGRLDRYGQKHRVKVANLRTPESWDARISAKIEAKLEKVQTSMGLVAEEDYRSMILGAVHEAINVVEVAACGSWLENERIEDAAVDNALQEVLRRRGSLEALFSESLGMPSNYGQGSATLTADDFRAAFSWAAAGYGIQLRETRTSENRLLKGVYHFTLPEAFRGGLRASRECHLVFDREHYAEVRNVNLGRVRGQEIKPTLGGFGDLVTDWFFRGALGVTQGNACFSMQRPGGVGESETWWIVYAARWKTSGSWAGPDAVMICAVDKRGAFIEFKENAGFFRNLQSALNPQNAVTPDQLPEFGQSLASCRNELRKIVDPAQAGSMLSLVPIGVVFLSSKKEGSAV